MRVVALALVAPADRGGAGGPGRRPASGAAARARPHAHRVLVRRRPLERAARRRRRGPAHRGAGIETSPRSRRTDRRSRSPASTTDNVDVFAMPAVGRRAEACLTYHPAADTVAGVDADGTRVLFASTRTAYSRFSELFTVGIAGGLPEKLPLPMAAEAPTPRTAVAWPTCRCSARSPRGNGTAGARRPDLDRGARRFGDREGAARQLERLQSHVDRRRRLLPVGSRRPHHAVRLRHRRPEDGEAVDNDGFDLKSRRRGPARSFTSSSDRSGSTT